ncbi:MAG: transglutaminase-like domain-containing protein, partial [Beijerinckiaceae bacterium]
LDRQAGSCRDLATLFAAAARSLGMGARLASGYLRNDEESAGGSVGAGTTHAWAEVYIPGAGWIAFDATNNRIGRGNLITVAVGRTMDLIAPVSGRFVSSREVTSAMSVDVSVSAVDGMHR